MSTGNDSILDAYLYETNTLFIDREREKIRLEFPKDTLWALEMAELPLMQRESPDRCRIER